MPIASIACLPRRGCTMNRVYLLVRAQCIQASLPSTRNPVSSNPATSLAVMPCRACSRNPSSRPAARAVSAATVPDEHGMPNSSLSASAVRSLDRNCPGVQVHDDRSDPRPVLHRRLRAGRRRALGALPAAAFPLDQLMLGHLGAHRLQVEDLAALHPGHRPSRQPGPAPAAAARLMADLPVRPGHLRQCRPLMPVLPAGLAAAFLPQRPRLRRRLRQPLTRRRPGGVPRVLLQPGLKLSDLLPGLRQLRPRLSQRGHRLGQHLIRRLPLLPGHIQTLCAANAHRASRHISASAQPHSITPSRIDLTSYYDCIRALTAAVVAVRVVVTEDGSFDPTTGGCEEL